MGISMPVHHMGAGRFRDLKTAALVTERLHHLGNIGKIRRQADVVDIGGENVVIASFQKDLTGGGADGVEMARGNALAVMLRNRPPSKEFLVDLVDCQRSEERREGKECVSKGRARGWRY